LNTVREYRQSCNNQHMLSAD